MPTNTKGYIRAYYERERQKIIDELKERGEWCGHDWDLEIHHKIPIAGKRPNGALARLHEWKLHMDNLKALCHDCHQKVHNGRRYWER